LLLLLLLLSVAGMLWEQVKEMDRWLERKKKQGKDFADIA